MVEHRLTSEAYPDEETARRRDDAVRRALTMPPLPKRAKDGSKPAPYPKDQEAAPGALPVSAGRRGRAGKSP